MIEEMIAQAQAYISQRFLPWSLATIGLVVGIILIRAVDHHLGRFFSTVGYDRTLEILCQRSVKWFLWVVLISLVAVGDPPALPGRPAPFDVSGSHVRNSFP